MAQLRSRRADPRGQPHQPREADADGGSAEDQDGGDDDAGRHAQHRGRHAARSAASTAQPLTRKARPMAAAPARLACSKSWQARRGAACSMRSSKATFSPPELRTVTSPRNVTQMKAMPTISKDHSTPPTSR